VRAVSLANVLRREFPMEYRRAATGTEMLSRTDSKAMSDLFDATRVFSTFRGTIGDSGTASRMSLFGGEGGVLERVGRGLLSRAVAEGYVRTPAALLGAVGPDVAAPLAGAAGGQVGRGAGGLLGPE
jgi:hypothetical protein